MANTQVFRYKEKLTVTQTPASDDNSLGALKANFPELELVWGTGVDVSESDVYWCDNDRSIATATNDDLDLTALPAAGSPTGAAVNMAEVRAIFIEALSSNTTVLTMQPGAANGWTALGAALALALEARAKLRLINEGDGAWPVSGSDKVLRIANAAGATARYRILIVGTST